MAKWKQINIKKPNLLNKETINLKQEYGEYGFSDNNSFISFYEEDRKYRTHLENLIITEAQNTQNIVNQHITDKTNKLSKEISENVDKTIEPHMIEIKTTVNNIKTDIEDLTNGLEEKIENTITSSMEENINEVKTLINDTKKHICCDICCAKNDIKKEIDEKTDLSSVEEKLSNLNEQVEEILKKLNN